MLPTIYQGGCASDQGDLEVLQGLSQLQTDAWDAGNVVGRTRRDIEAQTGRPVVSADNYLHLGGGSTKKKNRLPQGPTSDTETSTPE